MKYLVELNDNEYRLYTKKHLERIEKSAREFDGFLRELESLEGAIN